MQNVPKIVQQRLRAAKPAATHPDADVLAAFAERTLPEVERTAVLAHMARCGDCRDVVALALPEIEAVEMAVRPAPIRLTWPALRWGLVAAGVVALATFGAVQYQRHSQPSSVALKQSPNLEVAANEPKKQELAQFAGATAPVKQNKLQLPAAPAFTDSVSGGKATLDEEKSAKKGEARRETSMPAAGAAIEGASRVPGATVVGPLPHGPRLANQWQQQNPANNGSNQVQAAPPPAAFARQQAASAAASQAQTLDTESPSQPSPNEDDDSARVGKAKAAVPAASGGEVAMVNQPAVIPLIRGQKVQGSPGQIGGYVVDPSGAVVPNAKITITPANGQAATALTNSQGAWLIAGLPTGIYKAQAEAPGFNPAVLKVNNDPNRFSMYSFTLSVGSSAETVEVAGQGAQGAAEAASAVNLATTTTVIQSPANGRTFDSLTALRSVTWSITSAGSLQRSFDQGRTWQTVDVNANSSDAGSGTALQVAAKSSRPEAKDLKKAGKQHASTLIFRTIAAAGSDVWAGGNAGALYHSVDSGAHWARIAPASGAVILTGDIVHVDFSDSLHGSVSTSTSEVWNTTDAGQTWQKQ